MLNVAKYNANQMKAAPSLDNGGKVFEVARDLPCIQEGRFHYLRTWTVAEYALEIAPALYSLERAESKDFP